MRYPQGPPTSSEYDMRVDIKVLPPSGFCRESLLFRQRYCDPVGLL